jgi:hypothetical protein
MSLWSRIFGQKASIGQPAAAHTPQPARSGQPWSPLPTRGVPTNACLACRRKLNPLQASCPACHSSETRLADGPEWFAILQAHVTAVQANDTAV